MLSRFLHIDDTTTWNAFRNGNHDAFAHIYQAHFEVLYAYGKKFTYDDALIGDTLQQLFTEIWHKRARLGPTNHIKNYLYKSFRRSLLRRLRKKNGDITVESEVAFPVSISHEDHLIQEQLDIEQLEDLESAISMLSEKQREVIYLKFYDGLSYAEISEITGASNSQVYDLMYKALGSLRKKINKARISPSLSSSVITFIMICNSFALLF
jgi:RNA polymerase sigma factor (sigma-70 family)